MAHIRFSKIEKETGETNKQTDKNKNNSFL